MSSYIQWCPYRLLVLRAEAALFVTFGATQADIDANLHFCWNAEFVNRDGATIQNAVSIAHDY